MSESYIENSGEGTLKTYNKKIIYNFKASNSIRDYSNLINFNFGEKFFYGKVQRDFVPMFFDNNAIKLKSLSSAPSEGSSYSAAGFVADAFQDLVEQFSKAIASNKIYTDEQYLSRITATKAFTDPIALYNEHLITLTESLVGRLKEDETIEIEDFDDFVMYFKSLILKSCKEIPFTLSAYLKSKYCPMTVSGLVIEIADIDYFNDEEKVKNFYNSKNWEFYLNVCRSYGFSVDKDIPWRLVADIASEPMLRYAQRYGFGQTDLILNSGFSRPDAFFMKKFREYLLDVYNRVVENEIAKLRSCKNGLIVQYKKPRKYNIEQLESRFNDSRLLELFFDIRFAEDPKVFTKEKKDAIIRKCLEINLTGGPRAFLNSLRVFEFIINQPFDYNGSTSYLYTKYRKGFGDKIVLSKPRR
jgi:hypothetical protein